MKIAHRRDSTRTCTFETLRTTAEQHQTENQKHQNQFSPERRKSHSTINGVVVVLLVAIGVGDTGKNTAPSASIRSI
jgi:ABC-type transport system involved in cytochrome bd biosynthesis fused ATPase/permease subunit